MAGHGELEFVGQMLLLLEATEIQKSAGSHKVLGRRCGRTDGRPGVMCVAHLLFAVTRAGCDATCKPRVLQRLGPAFHARVHCRTTLHSVHCMSVAREEKANGQGRVAESGCWWSSVVAQGACTNQTVVAQTCAVKRQRTCLTAKLAARALTR